MNLRRFGCFFILLLLLSACRSTKFVPDNEYLLDKAKIKMDKNKIDPAELKNYLRQTPNVAILWLFRTQLGIYNLAGKDSANWLNITLKRIGEEPVIYSPTLMSISVQQLQKALVNKGYLLAKVQSDVSFKNNKASVIYTIKANQPYTIRNYTIDLPHDTLVAYAHDKLRSLIKPNMLFNTDILNAERERIALRFRRRGYYNFNKEMLTYTVDTALNSFKVDVTLQLKSSISEAGDSLLKTILKPFKINKVIFQTNLNNASNSNLSSEQIIKEPMDTVSFRNFILISTKKKRIKLDALVQNDFIEPGQAFSDRDVDRTYQALNSLAPVKYVNISFKQVKDSLLDCNIVVAPSKPYTISTELEGTRTGEYWGMAGKINSLHRNVFNGAESLSLQARAAVEKQNTLWAQEWGLQIGLKFPRLMAPLLSYDFKRNMHVNTEFISSYNSQFRPGEFTTRNIGGGMKYSWINGKYTNSYQLFDLSYVYFPEISSAFRNTYLNPSAPKFNPANYIDHFIMRMGYSGSYTNASSSRTLQSYSASRYSIETAGNVMYALDKLLDSDKKNGYYTLFNVRYSEYVKMEYNFIHHSIFDKKNRMVYHLGAGVGVPFGNADVIPFEKRFYSGGANSIRGWNESTLGPGVYNRIANRTRDYNQVGDIKLDMSMEYRGLLTGIFNGALFVDAGNIWTNKNYSTQAGGAFKLNTFMNQIAIAYGSGIRMDLTFFVLRVDVGMRLFNPANPVERQWRLNPSWAEDGVVHFAIGYPF
jgi:outer membrane protein assembly factor BamA